MDVVLVVHAFCASCQAAGAHAVPDLAPDAGFCTRCGTARPVPRARPKGPAP